MMRSARSTREGERARDTGPREAPDEDEDEEEVKMVLGGDSFRRGGCADLIYWEC